MNERPAERAAYLRNFVFGVEDSLVSTVGLLSGIAIAGMAREDIFVTGLILIFVEAISMCAGSFLAESSAEEYETKTDVPTRRSYGAAAVMFFSYFISGFVPLGPYLFVGGAPALLWSISLSVACLFVLGIVSARISHTNSIKSMMRMVIIGGIAIGAGILVGGFAR